MTGRIHQFVWSTVVVLTLGGVIAYAVAYGGLARMFLLSSVLALFAASLAFVLFEESPDRGLWIRRLVVWSAVGGPLADGLVSALGGVGLGVLLVLVLTSPELVGFVRRQMAGRASRGPAGPLEVLSERELLRRWEGTTAALSRGRISVPARMALADERSRLLDEIERRDPERFSYWVATVVPEVRGGRKGGRER